MLIISRDVVLDAVETGPDHPLIGYDNIVTPSNIAATTAAANAPASNLANPATHLEWQAADTSTQYLTLTTDGVTPLGYIGIARHNFGSAKVTTSVEAYLAGVWTQIENEAIPGDDSPLMWRLNQDVAPQFRVKVQPGGGVAPRASVLYAGRLLVMERRIYSGHAPITHARKLVVSNNRSESGEFLGRIITGEGRETTAAFKLISPAWYRENMPDFLTAAKSLPFFFVWRPASYPAEVGYVWLADDPTPANADASSNNLMAFELKLSGVA